MIRNIPLQSLCPINEMNNLVNVMEQFRGKPFVQLSNQFILVAPVSHHLINSAMPIVFTSRQCLWTHVAFPKAVYISVFLDSLCGPIRLCDATVFHLLHCSVSSLLCLLRAVHPLIDRATPIVFTSRSCIPSHCSQRWSKTWCTCSSILLMRLV